MYYEYKYTALVPYSQYDKNVLLYFVAWLQQYPLPMDILRFGVGKKVLWGGSDRENEVV